MDTARVYLGGLSYKVTAEDLHKYLSIYGSISEIKLRPGFGFVQFESDKDARDVVHTFSTRQFLGQDVTVQIARPDRYNQADSAPIATPIKVVETAAAPLSDSSKKMKFSVCVKGLNPRTCWQELKDFGRASGGDVAYCDIDRETRTQGFINYTREEDADRAVRKLDGQELLGYVVRLKRHYPTGIGRWERPRDERSRSPSRRTHTKSSDRYRHRDYELHSEQRKPSRSEGDWRDRPYRKSCYEEEPYDPYGYHQHDYYSDQRHHTEASPWADYMDDHYYERYHDRERVVVHPAPLLLPRREHDSDAPLLPRPDPATLMLIPRLGPPSPTTPSIMARPEPSTPLPVSRPRPTTSVPLLGLDFGTSPVLASKPGHDRPVPVFLTRSELSPLPLLPPRPQLSTLGGPSD